MTFCHVKVHQSIGSLAADKSLHTTIEGDPMNKQKYMGDMLFVMQITRVHER